jgi:hypothetical protein
MPHVWWGTFCPARSPNEVGFQIMALSGASKGSLDRKLRLIKRVLVLSFVFAWSVYFGELCFMRYRCAKAARLIDSVQRLKIGVTPAEEVRQLSERYGGEFYAADNSSVFGPNPPRYDLSVWSPYLLIRDTAFSMPGPGLRIWGVSATLYIKNGKLAEVYLSLMVRRSDELDLSSSVAVRNKLLAGPEGVSYYVVEPHVTGPPTEALHAELSPGASPEEQRKAFEFNPNCLVAFRECRHVCEISPSNWKALEERRRSRGEIRERIIDIECRQSLSGTK